MHTLDDARQRQYPSPWWLSPIWIATVALGLRLGWILVAHTYRFKTVDDDFGFGFEMGRIGRALAQGNGFSNPFQGVTGATAWEPPLYPFLIAGVFKLFGIYSRSSSIVLLSLNSGFSALTSVPIFRIANRCVSGRVAVWSAWGWALLPPVIYWCTRLVWETSLAALLLALIFWLALCMEEIDGSAPWTAFGLLWGVAALSNTSLLAFLPASGLWVWYRRAKAGKGSFGGVVLAGAMFAACIAPWLIRNQRVMGQFVFIRSNFGAELRLGNGPGADGRWMEAQHPTKNTEQLALYRQMGEMAYVEKRRRDALEFIRQDFGRFAGLSVKRFVYYWGGLPHPEKTFMAATIQNSWLLATSLLAFCGLGLALRRRKPGAWLFLWLMLSYPAAYYFVFPHPRYRHPIEPEMAILVAFIGTDRKGHG